MYWHFQIQHDKPDFGKGCSDSWGETTHSLQLSNHARPWDNLYQHCASSEWHKEFYHQNASLSEGEREGRTPYAGYQKSGVSVMGSSWSCNEHINENFRPGCIPKYGKWFVLRVNLKFISAHHHQTAVVYCVDLFSPSSSKQSLGSSAHSLQQGKKKAIGL